MKICIITGSWPPAVCGVGDAMRILGEKLSEAPGNEVGLITSVGYGSEKGSKPRVFPIVPNWGFSGLGIILKKIGEISPDVVHIQYPTKEYGKKTMVNFLPFFLKLAGFKVVITIHEYSHNLSWLGRVRLWPSIFFADRVFVSDPSYIGHIRSVFFWKKVIPLKIASNIPPSGLSVKERSELKMKLTGGKDSLLLGYFGFLNRNKIVKPIVSALKELREKKDLPAKLLLIGDIDWESSDAVELKKEIDRLGMNEHCVVTGKLEDCEVANRLAVLDFAVLLYSSGLSPRNATFLSAQGQGVRIITTKNPDLAQSYTDVFFIEVGGDDEMSAKIVDVIVKNREKKTLVSSESVFEKSWADHTAQHVVVYQELVSGRRP